VRARRRVRICNDAIFDHTVSEGGCCGATGAAEPDPGCDECSASELDGLLPALHIKDPATQAKITAVIGILLSEVESVAAIVLW